MRTFRNSWLLPLLALFWLVTTASMCPGNGPTEPGGGRATEVGGYMEIRPAAPGPNDVIRFTVPTIVKSGNPSGDASWSIAVYRGRTDETAQRFQPGASNLVRLINKDDALRPGETLTERTIQLPLGGYTIGFYLTGTTSEEIRNRAVYRRLNISPCEPLRIVGFPDTLTLGTGPTPTFRNLPDTGNLLNPEPIDPSSIPEARIGEEFVLNSFFLGSKVLSGPNTFVRQFELLDVAPELGLAIVNNEIRGIPAEGSSGTHWVLVRVSDECGGRTPPGSGPLPGPTGPAYQRWITVRWPIRVLNNVCPPVEMGPATLPVAVLGEPYTVTFAPTGGTPPFTYREFARLGIFPPGLTLTPTGLAGPLTQAGEFDFEIEVTDSCTTGSPRTDRLGYRLTVLDPADCPAISLRSATLPPGEVGEEYGWEFFSGGFPPVTVVVTGDSLPPGLSIDTTSGLGGTLPGIPTTDGEFSFTLEMTDSCSPPQTAARSFTVSIADPPSCPTLGLGSTPFPNGDVGVAYDQLIDVTGGVDPIDIAVSVGTLPTGLTINIPSKRIVGTPTVAGTYNFNLQVVDSCTPEQAVEQAYTIVIDEAATCGDELYMPPISLPDGEVGVAYPDPVITVLFGVPPLSFTLSSGQLPDGLFLVESTGEIVGVPTGPVGTFPFEITVTDSCDPPRSISGEGSIQITEGGSGCNPLTLNPLTLDEGTVGTLYEHFFGEWTNGGEGDLSFFSQAPSNPPPGLTLDQDTGTLSGIPTTAGVHQFVLLVTDECDPQQQALELITITIN